jgi:hypothetical protein
MENDTSKSKSRGRLMSADMIYSINDEDTQQANYHQINQELQERRMDKDRKDNEVRLWKNKDRETELHPNYTGNGLVEGKEFAVKLWMNVSKKGDTWFKLKFEEPWKKPSGGDGSYGNYTPAPAPAPEPTSSLPPEPPF